jgi:hypothetical protein
MPQSKLTTQFKAQVLAPATSVEDSLWAFVMLPKDISALLVRRGRLTVIVSINGHDFHTTLEPDGQLSHWFKLSEVQAIAAGVSLGELAVFEITPFAQEPEPELPSDLQQALAACPAAQAMWQATTTIARVDWIHWISTAKQSKTRTKRISDACDMLAAGKRRVCCFDPSGFYSKALSAPKRAD